MVKRKIREQSDQVIQEKRNNPGNDAGKGCQKGYKTKPELGGCLRGIVARTEP